MAHQQANSIYGKRFVRCVDEEVVTPQARRGNTPRPLLLPVVPHNSSSDWSSLRKVQPVNYMLPRSIAWLKTLPWNVRPMALVAKYPRIANSMALEWDRPAACRAYFVELLIDHRGARKGFPPDVHRDLTKLRDHYYGQAHALQLVE